MLEGHSGPVITFLPDSKLLVLVLMDGTIKLWDIRSGAAVRTLKGHSNWVSTVAFSPNGKLLVLVSVDDTVKYETRVRKVYYRYLEAI